MPLVVSNMLKLETHWKRYEKEMELSFKIIVNVNIVI